MHRSLGFHRVQVRAGDLWDQFIPAYWEGTGPLRVLWDTRIVRLFADGIELVWGEMSTQGQESGLAQVKEPGDLAEPRLRARCPGFQYCSFLAVGPSSVEEGTELKC